MNIRPTITADIPAITRIYAHAVLHGTATFELEPPAEAEMLRRFDKLRAGAFPYVVAEIDGAVVGYAYAALFRERPAYRFTVEDSIYIAPEMHGRGIGRALLMRLIADTEAAGYRQMIAVIGDSAQAASIAVHRACGFRDAGVFEAVGFKFGRWLDTVQMQRALGDGNGKVPKYSVVPAKAGTHSHRRSLTKKVVKRSCLSETSRRMGPRLRGGDKEQRRGRKKLTADHRQRLVDDAQDAIQFVTAAQDVAGGGDHAVGALALLELRIFFDAIQRHFRGAAEHRKHRAVFQEVDGVIAPFAGCDHAAVQVENAVEFAAVESDLIEKIHGGARTSHRGSTPGELAGIDIAGTDTHAAPPFVIKQ